MTLAPFDQRGNPPRGRPPGSAAAGMVSEGNPRQETGVPEELAPGLWTPRRPLPPGGLWTARRPLPPGRLPSQKGPRPRRVGASCAVRRGELRPRQGRITRSRAAEALLGMIRNEPAVLGRLDPRTLRMPPGPRVLLRGLALFSAGLGVEADRPPSDDEALESEEDEVVSAGFLALSPSALPLRPRESVR